ncbi:hypothetical protein HQ585_07885 [candidate division KSB1 bacterium]|nr:hypothetical protein [candidate division KSB1 bacterium]
MMTKQHIWKIIAVLALAVLMVAGCGKKDDDNGNIVGPSHDSALVGTWISASYIIFGGDPVVPDPDEGILPVIEVTLNADGTLEYTRTQEGVETTGTGTWSTSGSEATINLSDGMGISGTYSLNEAGDELTVDATVTIDVTPDNGVDDPVDVPATIVFDKVE